MGGKGSGGYRIGAGRKSKSAAEARLHGTRQRGATIRPGAVTAAPLEPVAIPTDLPADQVLVWNELAPHALTARTLTPATAFAFRDLCEAVVLKRKMLAAIDSDGLTTSKVTLQMDETGGGLQQVEPKAHPLISQHRGMMQRVEAALARFRLSPDGKPSAPVDVPQDGFAEFDGPTLVKPTLVKRA